MRIERAVVCLLLGEEKGGAGILGMEVKGVE